MSLKLRLAIRLALLSVTLLSLRAWFVRMDPGHRGTLEMVPSRQYTKDVDDNRNEYANSNEYTSTSTRFHQTGQVDTPSYALSPEGKQVAEEYWEGFEYPEEEESLDEIEQKLLRRARRKRAHQRREYERMRKRIDLKVPFPIFVPSLPKSGTTTVHRYFRCGGQRSAHLAGRNRNDGMVKIGRCTQINVMKGRPPFEGCGDFDIWTDTGYVATQYRAGGYELEKENIQCFYPLIDALEETYAAYPNATFLFVVRNTDSWLDSLQTYHDGFIMDVWRRCKMTGSPGLDGTLKDFRVFYEWHKEMIRSFVRERPSLTYIEVPLEGEDTGQILEERIGIDASCWGHHNRNREGTYSSTHYLEKEA